MRTFAKKCFDMEDSMKNNADAIIFHTAVCAENVTSCFYPIGETAFADFSYGSSNVNVLGHEG